MKKSVSKFFFESVRWMVLLFFVFLFPNVLSAKFVRGADVGWLQQMEQTGYKFYDNDGVAKDCLQILKEHGINTIRLRVWVHPSDNPRSGHCSTKDVTEMALRAQKIGMQLLIDFHYSDSWADPHKQNKPAAWVNDPFPALVKDVYHFTHHVLDTLKSVGIVPEWVQVGNEISNGMLWPDGSTKHWPQLAQLLNAGYDAVKNVDPSTKVIIHLDQGNNNAQFVRFFNQAKRYHVRFDVIGASYYPYWLKTDYTTTIHDLAYNLNDMVRRYHKPVMVVEVGGEADHPQNTYDMLRAVIRVVKEIPHHQGLGVIYWEPEGAQNWSGYPLSCWGNNGRPTKALDAFIPPKNNTKRP
ncbi:MAG: glycoside hydrolase family 53 protein [Microbacter sp.]